MTSSPNPFEYMYPIGSNDKIAPGDPRGPRNINVSYRGGERCQFEPIDITGNVARFNRIAQVDFFFSPTDSTIPSPTCNWSPIAIVLTRDGDHVGGVFYEFDFEFTSNTDVKCDNRMRLGPATFNVWQLELFDRAGERLTTWREMFKHRHRCADRGAGSYEQVSPPKTILSWDAVRTQVNLIELFPQFGNYWYEYC